MNICVSSTINWNPGDEFIRYGVINLLKKLLGKEHNYFIWNRNPDFFEKAWQKDSMKEEFWSNSVHPADLAWMDAFVFAGTPEWFGNPTYPIYAEALKNKKPLILLGAGAGRPLDLMSSLEKQVLRSPKTFLCVRSIGLAEELKKIDISAHTLPCPAILCQTNDYNNKEQTGRIGFLLQTSSVLNQQSDLRFAQDFFRLPPQRNYILLASYIDEARENCKKQVPFRFSFEPKDYFDFYKECDWIVTTRLHGVLSSLACGVPAVLLADTSNVRIQSSAALYKEILPVATSLKDGLQIVQELSGKQYIALRQNILQFKKDLEAQYIHLLRDFLHSIGL